MARPAYDVPCCCLAVLTHGKTCLCPTFLANGGLVKQQLCSHFTLSQKLLCLQPLAFVMLFAIWESFVFGQLFTHCIRAMPNIPSLFVDKTAGAGPFVPGTAGNFPLGQGFPTGAQAVVNPSVGSPPPFFSLVGGLLIPKQALARVL